MRGILERYALRHDRMDAKVARIKELTTKPPADFTDRDLRELMILDKEFSKVSGIQFARTHALIETVKRLLAYDGSKHRSR